MDGDLLAKARRLDVRQNDAALIDEALRSLLARHRAAEIDATYSAYDAQPLGTADEWGDLASFREAAAGS